VPARKGAWVSPGGLNPCRPCGAVQLVVKLLPGRGLQGHWIVRLNHMLSRVGRDSPFLDHPLYRASGNPVASSLRSAKPMAL